MVSALQSASSGVGNLTNPTNLGTGMISASGQTAEKSGTSFGDLFHGALGKVNELEDHARTAINGFITGTGVDVHDVMIASEKASMAFEMALAVRNKAIQSYQSVMSMQF